MLPSPVNLKYSCALSSCRFSSDTITAAGFPVSTGILQQTLPSGPLITSMYPFPFPDISIPVSYTHLDVYKRQGDRAYADFVDADIMVDLSDYAGLDKVQDVYLTMAKQLELRQKEGQYCVPFASNAAGVLYNLSLIHIWLISSPFILTIYAFPPPTDIPVTVIDVPFSIDMTTSTVFGWIGVSSVSDTKLTSMPASLASLSASLILSLIHISPVPT